MSFFTAKHTKATVGKGTGAAAWSAINRPYPLIPQTCTAVTVRGRRNADSDAFPFVPTRDFRTKHHGANLYTRFEFLLQASSYSPIEEILYEDSVEKITTLTEFNFWIYIFKKDIIQLFKIIAGFTFLDKFLLIIP